MREVADWVEPRALAEHNSKSAFAYRDGWHDLRVWAKQIEECERLRDVIDSRLSERIGRLESAIRWALSAPTPPSQAAHYGWRDELARLAFGDEQ